MSKRGNPARQSWDPIRIVEPNARTPMAQAFFATDGRKHHYRYRHPQRATACKAFSNRLYDGVALTFEDGSMHLSFKRLDRSAIRDWRHFQAIKNEVAGPDREAIEIFPAEDNLVDAANEYHLWVLPPDMESPLGMEGTAALMDAADHMDHAAYRQGGPPGARQRAWEEGIPTGLGRAS
jgi:hypothetical protein